MIAEPGEAWNYSQGLDVLGGVIEAITGQTLGDAIQARVSGPLGMTDTAFFQPASKSSRFAQSEGRIRCITTTLRTTRSSRAAAASRRRRKTISASC
jgi:CubicO group peptidase (beta-lactamase class C family)